MDSEAFTRCINNGLGRAILWLRQHPWRQHEEAIKHVCLHNTAYDPQCEGSRAAYVREIIGLTDAPRQFADLITNGLMASKDYWDTDQLFDLAGRLAKKGDAAAREAMYAKFVANDAAEHFLGASHIYRLDGIKGLLFVVGRIGLWTKTHPDYCVDDALLTEAQEELGGDVMGAVNTAARTNSDVAAYLAAQESWNRESACRPATPDYKNWTSQQLRREITDTPGEVPRGWLFGWGKHATEEYLREAAADLVAEHDPVRLLAYLRIFDRREFPLDHQRLIDLGTAEDADVAVAARRALRHTRSDDVRMLAMKLIEDKPDRDAIRLLVRNFAPGDEAVIEDALTSQADEDELHWICHATVDVLGANQAANVLSPMVQVYERCRCSLCRRSAVGLLVGRHLMPEWMIEECRFDSNKDIRKMFA